VSGPGGMAADRLERAIEIALDPGRFVSDRGCFSFVSELEGVEAKVAQVVGAAPARAVALYETFLAGCYEKAEEVDDSSGSFGMFAADLMCGLVSAGQAAGVAADETATRILAWMDNDPYGFCHRLDKDVAVVLDKAGLAALTSQVRVRFETAVRPAPVPGEQARVDRHARRRWAEVLRTLLAARKDVDAYVELAEESGLTPVDCVTVATMLAERDEPDQALSWADRGIELDARTPHGSFAGHELTELKARLLKKLGRDTEALETAWTDYRKHPSSYTYDHLMTFAEKPARQAWHEKAIDAAMDGTYLPSVMDLLLHTNETERLAQLVGRSADAALEGVSHHAAEPAATELENSHAGEAARIWRAQGVRILKAGKSKYYDAALRDLDRARRCYERAGLGAEWERVAAEMYAEHHRKTSFMSRFEAIANGSGPSRELSFLDRAKERWGGSYP